MLVSQDVFSSFAVSDTATAKTFYQDLLGIQVEEDESLGFLTLQLPSGGRVLLYPKPNHQPASFTVLNFMVKNIEESIDELVAKGIKFEKYDGFNQDERGISHDGNQAVAWFVDSSGNTLALIQEK